MIEIDINKYDLLQLIFLVTKDPIKRTIVVTGAQKIIENGITREMYCHPSGGVASIMIPPIIGMCKRQFFKYDRKNTFI